MTERPFLLSACCWWGLCLFFNALSVASASAAEESRFRRTVAYLQQAPSQEQGEFAFTALTELARAHAREAALAREELQLRGRDEKLRGWSIAVDQYAKQLLLLRDNIVPDFPPEFSLNENKPLMLVLGDRSIILSHPRTDQQSAFEHSILFEFCSRHDCDRFTAANIEQKPIPLSTSRVRPSWTFSGQGPLCAYRGIEVQFSSTSHMPVARMICEQFLQEVMTLDNELAWQRRHAVIVEWDSFSIAATPGQPQHMVRLNSLGDTILTSLPVLHSSAGLLQELKPWLRNRESAEGSGVSTPVKLQAVDYGWDRRQVEK